MSRRVGQSAKNFKGPSLHSYLPRKGNATRKHISDATAISAQSDEPTPVLKLSPTLDDDASPVSSDLEEDELGGPVAALDSSDDDSSLKADIKPSLPRRTTRATRNGEMGAVDSEDDELPKLRKGPTKTFPSNRARKTKEGDQDREHSEWQTNIGSQHSDALWTASQFKSVVTSYGMKSSQQKYSSSNKALKSSPVREFKKPPSIDDESPPKRRKMASPPKQEDDDLPVFKNHLEDLGETLDQPESPIKAKLRIVDVGVEDESIEQTDFKVANIDIEDGNVSPERKLRIPEIEGLRKPELDNSNSEIGLNSSFDDDVPDLFSPSSLRAIDRSLQRIEPSVEKKSFNVPDIIGNLVENGDLTLRDNKGRQISSTKSVIRALGLENDLDVGTLENERNPDDTEQSLLSSTHTLCPMCKELVPRTLLVAFSDKRRLTTRMQARFCQEHKARSAQSEWSSRGFPSIDWENLDKRLAKHHHAISGLLDGEPSFYRDLLADQVRTGKHRTLQASIMAEKSFVPGYYGSRGLRAISENIMKRFSPRLRRVAVKDQLIAARGVTGYVQAVLVPEAAVRLICEDMHVDVEEARKIMSESVAVGDLVNDELKDVIVRNPVEEDDANEETNLYD